MRYMESGTFITPAHRQAINLPATLYTKDSETRGRWT